MEYKYIKILTENLIHRYGYQWKIGLNSDQGGLYICKISDFVHWFTLYDNFKWIGYVTIPQNAEVVEMDNKIKVSEVVLHDPLIPIEEFIISNALKINFNYLKVSDIEWLIVNNKSHIINLLNKYAYPVCEKIIYWSCKNNRLDVIKELVNNGFDLSRAKGNSYILLSRMSNCSQDFIDYLVDNGAAIHNCDYYGLCNAAMTGDLDRLKYIVNRGADIKERKNHALRYAAEKGHIEIVEYLIEKGSGIHDENDYALRKAAKNNHYGVVKLLCAKGAHINANNFEAYILACKHMNITIVEWFIRHGVDVNTGNVLLYACQYSSLKFIKFLVGKGAKINDECIDVAKKNNRTNISNYLSNSYYIF